MNLRKRAEYRRKVQTALHQILNDPAVMPNVDCPDMVVSVNRVEFGATVRDIYVDFWGEPKRPWNAGEESPHDRYMREAKERGEDTYIDLTDVAIFPRLMRTVESELQRRLGLRYTPSIRRLCDLLDDSDLS